VLRRVLDPAFRRASARRDCPPVRVQLIRREARGFADSEAHGIVDEFARPARLIMSSDATRNPVLRCIYHGWKFDVDGNWASIR